MKQKYTAPSIKVVTIKSENVLTVSGAANQTKFGKYDFSKFGTRKDNSF